jgi:hypothetical protein
MFRISSETHLGYFLLPNHRDAALVLCVALMYIPLPRQMTRSIRKQGKPPSLNYRIALFVLVFALVFVFLILRGHGSAGMGRCPIDGQASEWSRYKT